MTGDKSMYNKWYIHIPPFTYTSKEVKMVITKHLYLVLTAKTWHNHNNSEWAREGNNRGYILNIGTPNKQIYLWIVAMATCIQIKS